MADETDVETALVDLIDAAIYPNGPHARSTVGWNCKIHTGWPISANLELDLSEKTVTISVYAVQSSSGVTDQPFNLREDILVPAVHGLKALVAGSTVTFSGAATPGEYATIVVGVRGYSYLTAKGDAGPQVAAGLLALVAHDQPAASVSGAVLTIPTSDTLIARLGAPVTMATRIHRQRQQFRVVTWAPNPQSRTAVARAIDVALKRENVIRLADGSQGLIAYSGTNPSDRHELNELYRRDLMFDVTYDTLDTYQAFEVTSVGINVDATFNLSLTP
jgi:hypothetical protein